MAYTDEIKVGSIVFIGEAAPLDRKTTWKVTELHSDGAGTTYATLRSGLSGRSALKPVKQLTLFRVKETP